MFAGHHATGFKRAKRHGLTISGFADGLPRLRLDDRTSYLTPLAHEYLADLWVNPFERPHPRSVPLHLLLTHSRLYRAYPELRLLGVSLDPAAIAAKFLVGPIEPRTTGSLRTPHIKIWAGPDCTPQRLHSVLLHKLQHRIQQIEGFAQGTNATYQFRQILAERVERHATGLKRISTNKLDEHISLQVLGNNLGEDLGGLLQGQCQTPYAPTAVAAHLFWRLRDYAKARYRQNPGEIEARQVQHELTLAGELPREHITITTRPYITRNRQSARFNQDPIAA
jgi:hypothetical protein